ncbi:MAG: gfo/Idh/MocA family oxidoreductase, partial [Gammaproteobacteria bacterium]|nr:gfo/Idh/MocA family oxidoreductase [Gammaproteobacteria bacterium]
MTRLRMAVLGAGLIGRRHIDTILACPGEAELVGVADPVAQANSFPQAKAPFFKTTEALLDR